METITPVNTINLGTAYNTIVLPALKYVSGERMWIAVTMDYKSLGKFVKTTTVKKKNQRIIDDKVMNRFLDVKHKNEIKDYIRSEPHYTIPPITLVTFEPLEFQIMSYNPADNIEEKAYFEQHGSAAGIVKLPLDYEFLCLDGNHRVTAIRELAEEFPEILKSSHLLLNIVYEPETKKIRQDFVDINKNAKATTASINTLFNTRNRLSNMVVDLLDTIPYLNATTERLSASVSKNSTNLYTINNIKNAIVELAGMNCQSKTMVERLSEKLADQEFYDTMNQRAILFFEALKDNEYIAKCLEEKSQVPIIKTWSIVTTGVGLVIISRLAGSMFQDENLDANEELQKIVHFNWSRENMEKYPLVTEKGNITASITSITETGAKLAELFGYKE